MSNQPHRKVRQGVVVSNKMHKTITVKVERTYPHPRYKKVIRWSKKYYAHHEKGDLNIGEKVLIQETRPLSKLKRWIVVDVLSSSAIENTKASDRQ